jgi:hypothetical protein
MAILTISVNSNYSAIKGSLANGDTIRIDTNAVRLTVDEQPLLTNITVDSPSVSGRMTVSGAYDLSTWSVIAGTVALIDGTFPAGAILGSATGGSAFSAYGVNINAGTVTTATGSSGTGAGVNINNGTVTTANGGPASSSYGVGNNNGTVTTSNGGSAGSSHGVNTNSGTVITANGGSAASATGVSVNNGHVTTANGGTNATAYGVNTCLGGLLRAFDGTALGVNLVRSGPRLIIGPDWQTATTNYNVVGKIYSIGEVSGLAAIPGGIEIVTLSEGSGGGFPLSRVLN